MRPMEEGVKLTWTGSSFCEKKNAISSVKVAGKRGQTVSYYRQPGAILNSSCNLKEFFNFSSNNIIPMKLNIP